MPDVPLPDAFEDVLRGQPLAHWLVNPRPDSVDNCELTKHTSSRSLSSATLSEDRFSM